MKRLYRLHIRLASAKLASKEWLFDNPKRVTFGYLPEAAVSVADPEITSGRMIFRRKGGDLQLRLAPDLTGSLQIGGKDIPLEDLREVGLLQSDGQGEFISLHPKTYGTVVVGTTPFQFWVSLPPDEPEYPRGNRLVDRFREIPLVYVIAFVISIGLHHAFYRIFSDLPPPAPPTARELDQRFARFTLTQEEYARTRIPKTKRDVARGQRAEARKAQERSTASFGGFLAAVEGKKETASPFQKLFTTDSLGKSLDDLLGGKNLDDAIAKQLASPGGIHSNLDYSTKNKAKIGSLRQKGLGTRELDVSTSRPVVARFDTSSPLVEGSLDQERLEGVVAMHAGQMRACYERALSRNRKLSGKVVLKLVVQADGRPSNVVIEKSNMNDRGLERCLIQRISTWIFPRPVGGPTPVRFPFIFTSAATG